MKTLKTLALGAAFIAGGLALSATAAQANPDTGLYDPLPPEGSAFVRYINDFEDKGSEKAIANGKTFDYLDYKEVSSYFVVPEGNVKAAIGEQTTSFDVEAGKFYTVVLTGANNLIVNTDMVNDNRSKSQISFYNLTDDKDLTVKTSDGKVEIVPLTSVNKAGDRQINPVKVSLGVFDGDVLIKDLGDVSMERAASYSIVAYNPDEIVWIPSTTNTTR